MNQKCVEVIDLALKCYLVLIFGLVFYGQASSSCQALLAQWHYGPVPMSSADFPSNEMLWKWLVINTLFL